MGSAFESREFKACDEQTLKGLVRGEIDQAGFESGHSYSGDWGDKHGFIVKPVVVTDRDEAYEWIDKHFPDKDDPLVAIKMLGEIRDRKTKSIENRRLKILERMNNHRLKLGQGNPMWGNKLPEGAKDYGEAYQMARDADILRQIIQRVATEKAQFKTCQSCQSKINKKYLTRHQCPVCGDEEILLTNTDKKRIEGIKAKISECQSQIDALDQELKQYLKDQQDKMLKDGHWLWFVGGWCRD